VWPSVKSFFVRCYRGETSSFIPPRTGRINSIQKALLGEYKTSENSAPVTPVSNITMTERKSVSSTISPVIPLTVNQIDVELDIEKVPLELELSSAISVKNLRKTYPNGTEAVRGVTFDMYFNQITCLLGHVS
jgi:hypothetical protein